MPMSARIGAAMPATSSRDVALSICSVAGEPILEGVLLAWDDQVQTLARQVQSCCSAKHVTLLTADGQELSENDSIQGQGLVDGDWLTAAFVKHDVLYLVPSESWYLMRYDITAGMIGGFDCRAACTETWYEGFTVERFSGAAYFADQVYLMPYDADYMMIHNTRSDTMETVDVSMLGQRASKWKSPIVANGKLFGIPHSAESILVFDLMAKVVRGVDVSHVETGKLKWHCAVLDGDEIVAMPCCANSILIYNVVSGEVSSVDVASMGGNVYKWNHSLKYKRKVYAIPGDCPSLLIYDCVTKAVSGVDPSVVAPQGPCSGAIIVNGKLYTLHHEGGTMIVYDIATGSLSGVDVSHLGEGGWAELVAVDGVIYGAPRDSKSILKYDTRTGLASGIDVSSFAHYDDLYMCADVVVIEDKLYFVPNQLKFLLVYDINRATLASIDVSFLSGGSDCMNWVRGMHVADS